MKKLIAVAICTTACLAMSVLAKEISQSYAMAPSLGVGGPGGWDYPSIDSQHRRLFLSRGDRVDIVDLSTGKPLAAIAGTTGVHGIAFAQSLERGYTSNGRANTVTEFDLTTLQRIRDISISGKNPDAILFEPTTQRVFTFNGRSADASVIDPVSGTQVGSIALGGKPEFGVVDGKGKVYVNIEDRAELVEIDAKTMSVLHAWPLKGCEEPSGLAFDIDNRRLFSVCGNGRMTVTDANDGHQVAILDIGDGSDGAVFDPALHLAFSANGESGTLTVVREDSSNKFRVIQTLPTQVSARTITLDEQTHTLYLPAAEFEPKVGEQRRGTMKPGSFKVLAIKS